MARILAISSQTVYGPVGNSAAVPPMHERGHDVVAIPTTLLSHHPGLGRPAGRVTDPQLFQDFLTRLDDIGVLETCDAVSTGYFASAEQIDLTAETITLVVMVDPVIGDNNALYVPQSVAIAIRDRLWPLASIATPNRFELGWLTASEPADDLAFTKAANKAAIAELIVTSAFVNDDTVTTLHIADDMITRHIMPNLPRTPNGTGDFLAGQYLAHRLGMSAVEAFNAAMRRVQYAVTVSAGQKALHLGVD